ncbi:MAG: uroporphyrinogen decarboxylase [Chloroflexi bacterium]|nr:uroporphyrinogen decarboxylase [Chloroflexota bacterium]
MAEMTKRERVKAALAGETVDRVPVSFWRHWPGDDQKPVSLALVALDFQRRYDLDFIKVPVSSVYCVEDYGVTHTYSGNCMGDREYLERVIRRVEDWDRIQPLDVHKGCYGRHLEALRMIIDQKESDTPVIFTMFNPLAMAAYLAGDENLFVHLRSEPHRVLRALEALAETSARFVHAALAEGCDGIFLSTRFASYELMNEDEYRQFGRTGDLAALTAASKGGWFNVLHLHGQHPMFIPLSDYPVQAVNWHDRTAWPGLAEAGKLVPHALMGGVEQFKTLHFGSPAEVKAQVQDAIQQMRGRRLIVTTGCTYPLDVPHSNLLTMRQAVGE